MNTPQTDLINTRTLFLGADDRHTCCSCCAGYCPRDDMAPAETDEWPELFRVEVAGVAYLTDRYVAVRADLCGPVPEGVPVGPLKAQKDAVSKGYVVPEVQPPVTESRITALMWDRVDRATLTVHGESADGLRVLHLYLGDRHVGWVMTANEGSGITRHRLSEVRRVAQAAGITLRQAEKAVWAVIEG
jgi:hypothetical protein